MSSAEHGAPLLQEHNDHLMQASSCARRNPLRNLHEVLDDLRLDLAFPSPSFRWADIVCVSVCVASLLVYAYACVRRCSLDSFVAVAAVAGVAVICRFNQVAVGQQQEADQTSCSFHRCSNPRVDAARLRPPAPAYYM